MILESIREMPKGGQYKINSAASAGITNAIRSNEGQLAVQVNASAPSYCSGATYLVFLKTLEKLQKDQKIEMSPATVKALGTKPQGSWLADGNGVWGRWNSNGPGTAGLFSELDLGYNFVDDSFTEAKPGDFLKIYWKDDVGKNEAGHSVVFTGVKRSGSKVTEVCFWSSNTGQGYGEKCVPRSKVAKAMFSRLTKPENIQGAGQGDLRQVDPYLASLLRKESSFAEAVEKTNSVVVSATGARSQSH